MSEPANQRGGGGSSPHLILPQQRNGDKGVPPLFVGLMPPRFGVRILLTPAAARFMRSGLRKRSFFSFKFLSRS
jgi:hypothetical protein